ncbi:unnamed protein product [Leuciscus chuanchicus]
MNQVFGPRSRGRCRDPLPRPGTSFSPALMAAGSDLCAKQMAPMHLSVSQNEELALINCLLPDDVLGEILSERLQLSDCQRGVVIDGLETLFSKDPELFEQEQVERRQQELESLRAEEMTPSEDSDTRPREEDTPPPSEDLQQEMSSESDRQLLARFQLYEQCQTELQHVLQFWDRTQSLLLQPEGQETRDMDCPNPSAKKSKKEREKETAEKEKLKLERADMKSPAPRQTQVSTDAAEDSEKMVVPEPIPHIWLFMKEKEKLSALEIISSMKLPSHEEIYTGGHRARNARSELNILHHSSEGLSTPQQ